MTGYLAIAVGAFALGFLSGEAVARRRALRRLFNYFLNNGHG